MSWCGRWVPLLYDTMAPRAKKRAAVGADSAALALGAGREYALSVIITVVIAPFAMPPSAQGNLPMYRLEPSMWISWPGSRLLGMDLCRDWAYYMPTWE